MRFPGRALVLMSMAMTPSLLPSQGAPQARTAKTQVSRAAMPEPPVNPLENRVARLEAALAQVLKVNVAQQRELVEQQRILVSLAGEASRLDRSMGEVVRVNIDQTVALTEVRRRVSEHQHALAGGIAQAPQNPGWSTGTQASKSEAAKSKSEEAKEKFEESRKRQEGILRLLEQLLQNQQASASAVGQ